MLQVDAGGDSTTFWLFEAMLRTTVLREAAPSGSTKSFRHNSHLIQGALSGCTRLPQLHTSQPHSPSMFAVTMCRALALPFSMMMITACEVKIVVSAAVGSILMDYTVLSRTARADAAQLRHKFACISLYNRVLGCLDGAMHCPNSALNDGMRGMYVGG